MNLKVGDKVKIISYPYDFGARLYLFIGKTTYVTEVYGDIVRLNIDSGDWAWGMSRLKKVRN